MTIGVRPPLCTDGLGRQSVETATERLRGRVGTNEAALNELYHGSSQSQESLDSLVESCLGVSNAPLLLLRGG